jgi:tRNA uridine 5-carboxymethylaminomethyl modification enzyme
VAIAPTQANPILEAAGEPPLAEPIRIRELCRRPGVSLTALFQATSEEHSEEATEWADIEIKYEGYLAKERAAAARLAGLDEMELPDDLVYQELLTISSESREKLGRFKPGTVGEAGRIPGVSPADLQNLTLAVLRRRI